MQSNPGIEISECVAEHIMRYYGKAKNWIIVNKAFTVHAGTGRNQPDNGRRMAIFCSEDATAEIRNMFGIEESFEFK